MTKFCEMTKFCVEREYTTVNFCFYNTVNLIYVSSDLAPCKERALIGDISLFSN